MGPLISTSGVKWTTCPLLPSFTSFCSALLALRLPKSIAPPQAPPLRCATPPIPNHSHTKLHRALLYHPDPTEPPSEPQVMVHCHFCHHAIAGASPSSELIVASASPCCSVSSLSCLSTSIGQRSSRWWLFRRYHPNGTETR